MQKIKVLVVDDSVLMRKILMTLLHSDSEIDVVGSAVDPFDAREKIKKLQPDVLTLDVEMPGMNGLSFLDNLMRLRPMPVVMVSTLTSKGAPVTLKALELGAFDFIAKPTDNSAQSFGYFGDELCAKVKLASNANLRVMKTPVIALPASQEIQAERLIAIGASTGGTEALRELLTPLAPPFPPVVVTQHIPKNFSGAFAKRLNDNCRLTVIEVTSEQIIEPNHVYIAPGDCHLKVHKSGRRYTCQLFDGPAVNRHKPSVDVLFDSVATTYGAKAIGVMLTGMGKDGAEGLLSMRQTDAVTIAQDEASSVVWGMPGAAVQLGAVMDILSLPLIAPKLAALVQKKTGKAKGVAYDSI
ncbi:chemotaxis response regulator protein-glutamate methylesterase [Moritella sp. 28]|uniref:protein-glutamate methylesterase/protein-glutamine glutaminase n=1 Tax=Moritella sp. 28 TaxID=2746232 RepID=UPI001BADFD4B|nr:chemotaxis response regulator protein-glutamate methylesterase [Moritella sp. 28]QUM86911.1 chemotaxis response regulator protein-glutamate methylesterase [Moritella sp. 28]